MNEQVTRAMFALIRHVVCGAELTEGDKAGITPEILPQLYALSKSHDMAHIVAQGLSDLGLLGEDELSQKFQKQQMLAIYRYQKLNYELERIYQILEDAKIPFIPLKGSVIRKYYPEPWMRTSCDIDILVHEENLDQAIEILQTALHYKIDGNRNYHDISLFSESGIHLELHFNIQENIDNLDQTLSQVWEYTLPIENTVCYLQTNEFLLFHHIAHASYHFVSGGCGVRPLLDLWLLRAHLSYDEQQVIDLCTKCGIARFYSEMIKLSKVWFGEESFDLLTKQMSDYILKAGVYGNIENKIAIKQNQKGGKIQYIISRIWLPYNSLRQYYPILNRHKWLLPIMEICRWFRLLRKGGVKSSLHELNVNRTMSQEQVSETAALLQKLGLNESR
ncbi:MAG: hypothetical protein E7666_02165 [Ruminococcaceae bacterium]|nr:hypothetical protein [Oscillospiraceae bacterium]